MRPPKTIVLKEGRHGKIFFDLEIIMLNEWLDNHAVMHLLNLYSVTK